jgi:hypothetical protein
MFYGKKSIKGHTRKVVYIDQGFQDFPPRAQAKGKARQGKDRQGKARQGKARQGKNLCVFFALPVEKQIVVQNLRLFL